MSTQEQRFGLASLLVGIGLAVALAAGPALGITLPRSAIVVAFALAALLAMIGVGLLLHPAWRWGRRWWAGRGEPRLAVEPTGGPSQDLRLFVTNRGPKTEFHARATVVASRNYPNQLRKGSYVLLWLGPGTSTVTLDTGQSDSLLVARFKEHDLRDARMGQAQVIECNGAQEGLWDGFRWMFQRDDALPEFDIDVTIVGSGLSRLFSRRYTLRPAAWIGPLELIERPRAAVA